jgi:hypothetical protein
MTAVAGTSASGLIQNATVNGLLLVGKTDNVLIVPLPGEVGPVVERKNAPALNVVRVPLRRRAHLDQIVSKRAAVLTDVRRVIETPPRHRPSDDFAELQTAVSSRVAPV